MKIIFLIAASVAFFFSGLVFNKKDRSLPDSILFIWLIYLGLFIAVYAFYSHELFTHFRLISISLISLFMLHGPFLYLYTHTFISQNIKIVQVCFIHMVPFALFNLYIIIASFFPGLAIRLNMETLSAGVNPPGVFLFFLIITALSGPLYFVLTLKLFREFDISLFNNFSNTSGIGLYWLRRLVLVFGIVWTALIAITVIHHVFRLFSMSFCTDGLFISLSMFVILTGYYGLKQNNIYANNSLTGVPENSVSPLKHSGSKPDDSSHEKNIKKIGAFMKDEKPYLNPDITLPQLAMELNMQVYILSQVINEGFKMNFFDFVNSYRIDEFKKLVFKQEYSGYTLLGIAFECGFNSKTAFNRVFKKITGLTPSQYKNSVSV